MAFDFPSNPAIDQTYTDPAGGPTYTFDGVAWSLSPNAASDTFVKVAGDAMTGPLVLPNPNPDAPLKAAHKRYVDETVATNSLYQSVWQVAANVPDLHVPPNAPLHGYSWTAVTVDPNVPELAPATLPGIGGKSIGTNDGVVWNDTAQQYEHIPTPLLASAMLMADVPPGAAFHGQLWYETDTGKMFVWFDDGTSQQWVQVSGGGGGATGGIVDAPVDGTPYERQDAAWVPATGGAGGIADAPDDGQQYARRDAAWDVVAMPPGAVPDDAPADGQLYGRLDAAWSVVPAGGGGITDAPVDGTPYSRQDAGWVPAATGGGGITDAPADGTTYGRNNAAWTAVLSATDPIPYTVPVSDTAPAGVQGALWFNSADASLYCFFDDGTSAQWVEVSAA